MSTKQCELGIGEPAFASYRHKLVDYLPYMYTHQWMLQSRKPQPVATYNTILNPFDYYTWVFTFLCILVQFVLLLIVQNIWSKLSGRPNPKDYIYEGQNVSIVSDLI